MPAKVSSKRRTVVPLAIRQMARIQAGDELDVGFTGGLVVLRKRRPLTTARVLSLAHASGAALPPDVWRPGQVIAAGRP